MKAPADETTECRHGGQVAQSVEQRTENPCVECSIHSLPTSRIKDFSPPRRLLFAL